MNTNQYPKTSEHKLEFLLKYNALRRGEKLAMLKNNGVSPRTIYSWRRTFGLPFSPKGRSRTSNGVKTVRQERVEVECAPVAKNKGAIVALVGNPKDIL